MRLKQGAACFSVFLLVASGALVTNWVTIAGEMISPPWTSIDVRTEPDLAFHQVFRH
jgi:hypothetical protein